MSRLLLIVVVAILLGDASGVAAFVTPEACTSVTDTLPDGKCPSLCVRCACCAQPIVPAATNLVRSYELCARSAVVLPFVMASGSPRDILHVPK